MVEITAVKNKKIIQKNNFTWVIFIGPPAVGKSTIAKKIAKEFDYYFLHNHTIIDFIKNIIPVDLYYERKIFRYKLNLDILSIFAKNYISMTSTLAYAHDYITDHKIKFPDLLKKIQFIAKKHNGTLKVVHLKASLPFLLERTIKPSRKKYGKIKSKKLLKKVYLANDFETSPTGMIKNIKVILTDNMRISQIVQDVKIFLIK